MSDEHGDESANLHHESGEFRLSLLEAFDRILASVPIGDPVREELFALRPEIIRHEETIAEARPDDREARGSHQESDFAREPHRHVSRQPLDATPRTSSWAAPIIIATSIRAFRLRS